MSDLTHATFGPYRILEQIGAGGTSKVYKAYRPGLDRLVAVKVISEHLAQDPHFIQRFRQESQLIARLEHRAIVSIYDVGEQGGQIYPVMRYVQAGTVHDLLSYSPLHPRDIVSLISDIASALDYAHSQGVVHRDIKPGNVLIDKHGHAFLTDFGFAKVMAASVEITHSGDTVGTPSYMAPEQTLARPVTAQTDVYSLGVMVYELLTGQLLFRAETPIAQALKHVHAPVPRPRQFNPALSEATEGVILKALEKLPEDRYPTAGALAEALRQAAALEAPAPQAFARNRRSHRGRQRKRRSHARFAANHSTPGTSRPLATRSPVGVPSGTRRSVPDPVAGPDVGRKRNLSRTDSRESNGNGDWRTPQSTERSANADGRRRGKRG